MSSTSLESIDYQDTIPEQIAEKHSVSRMSVEKVRYSWTIEDFSSRTQKSGRRMYSPVFSQGTDSKTKWSLCLYTAGKTEELKSHVSLFLYLADSSLVDEAEVKSETSILDSRGKQVSTKAIEQIFTAETNSWGWDKFISRQRLSDKTAGLLVDDKLTFICTITAKFTPSGSDLLSKAVTSEGAQVATSMDEVSKLLEDLGRILETPLFHDVTLVIGNSRFPAHKSILAGRSSVFRAMFDHELKEVKEGRVNINGVKPEVMHEMLHFIYTGSVKHLEKNTDKLLAVADRYDLQGLISLCEGQLCTSLTVSNAIDTLALADLHSAKRLKAAAIELIVSHSAQIAKSSSWARIKKHPQLVLEVCEALALAK